MKQHIERRIFDLETLVQKRKDMQALDQQSGHSCLKVSSKSSPASVAGAIAGMVKDGVPVEMQAVGAGAVNQAVKAIAISRGFLSPVGIEVACIPSFADIIIDGEYRTAIHFSIRAQYLRGTTETGEGDFVAIGD